MSTADTEATVLPGRIACDCGKHHRPGYTTMFLDPLAAWLARTPGRYAAVLGAVGLAVAAVVQTVLHLDSTNQSGVYALVVCLVAVAATVPVLLPDPDLAAIVVTAAGLISVWVFHTPTEGAALAQVIGGYRAGRFGHDALPITFLFGMFYAEYAVSHPSATVIWLGSALPIAVGFGVTNRIRAQAIANRAARHAIAGTLLENTARGERARIARELHDVVAHHISMISVQAESARLTTPGLPTAGAAKLTAIGDTARAALTEMRRLLGVLREDAGSTTPELAPQPGLRQLNDLLDEARAATGASARLILRGPPVTLDPGVELAAYRIVQEALTNARRHAPGAAVDVEIHFVDGALQLTVRDNGPGPTQDRVVGHGLLGMRERAAAVGGDLRTGTGLTGGFLVQATLPTQPDGDR